MPAQLDGRNGAGAHFERMYRYVIGEQSCQFSYSSVCSLGFPPSTGGSEKTLTTLCRHGQEDGMCCIHSYEVLRAKCLQTTEWRDEALAHEQALSMTSDTYIGY